MCQDFRTMEFDNENDYQFHGRPGIVPGPLIFCIPCGKPTRRLSDYRCTQCQFFLKLPTFSTKIAPNRFDIHDKYFAQLTDRRKETVNHPQHYGGDTPTEPIKVIRAWTLGFNLGNAVKYIARAGKKGSALEDLKKARWYLDDEIKAIEGVPMPGGIS